MAKRLLALILALAMVIPCVTYAVADEAIEEMPELEMFFTSEDDPEEEPEMGFVLENEDEAYELTAPGNPYAVYADMSVKIGWDLVIGAEGYYVYGSTSSSGSYRLIKEVTRTSRQVVLSTASGYTYFKVCAYDNYNSEGLLTDAFGMTELGTVQNIATAKTGSQAAITWDSVQGADGYTVYGCATKSGVYTALKTVTETSASVSVPDGEYYFKVAAYLLDGDMKVYSAKSAAVEMRAMAAPTGLKAAKGYNSNIGLRWDAVAGAEYYQVYGAHTQNGPYYAYTTSSMPYTTISGSVTYGYFKVSACLVVTNNNQDELIESDKSAAAELKTMTEPTGLKAVYSAEAGQTTIGWDAVDGAESYNVYYAGSSYGTQTLQGSTTGTSMVTSRTSGYYYFVEAVTYINDLKYGSSHNYGDNASAIPVPTSMRFIKDGDSVNAGWYPVTGAVSYGIYGSSSSSGSFELLATVTGTQATIANPARYSYFAIRVNVNVGGVLVTGDLSYPTIASALSAPAGVIAVRGDDGVDIDWGTVSSVNGYIVYGADEEAGPYREIGSSDTTAYKVATACQYIRVAAYKDGGAVKVPGTISAPVQVLEPAQPTDVVVIHNNGSLTISGKAAAGTDGFALYGCDTPDGAYKNLATFYASEATRTAAVVNSYKYLKVKPIVQSSTGRYLYGKMGDAFDVIDLSATITVAAYPNGDQADISWNAIPGVTGYEVLGCNTVNGTYTLELTTTAAEATVAMPAGTRFYKIKPYMMLGETRYEGPLSAATTVKNVETPTGLKVVKGENGIVIGWNEAADADGYTLYGATSAAGSYTVLTNTSNTMIRLPATAEYISFKVAAYSLVSGVKAYSYPGSAEGIVKIGTVGGFKAYDGSGTAGFVWNAAANAEGYTIYGYNAMSGDYDLVLDTSATSAVAKTSFGGFKISAYSIVGEDKVYGPETTINKFTAIPVPTGMKAVKSGNQVNMAWNKVEGVEGYSILRGTSANGTFSAIKSVTGTATSTAYGEYFYKVRSYITIAGTKFFSANTAAVSVMTLPAPTGIVAVDGGNQINLAWNKVTGAAGYTLMRSGSKTGTFSGIKSMAGTATTSAKGTYFFKVKAYVLVGTQKVFGDVSAVVSVTKLAAPANVKAVMTASSTVTVSWDAVSGASGYQIARSGSKTGTFTAIKTVTGTTGTSAAPTSGNYFFKVRPYILVGTQKVYGAYGTAVETVLKAPVIKATPSAKDIKITWTAIPGAAKYEVYRATSKTGTYTKVATVSVASATLTGLSLNKTYYVKVRAIKGTALKSADSAIITTKMTVIGVPSVTATGTASSVKLSWPKVEGAASYIIYQSPTKTGTYTKIATVTGTTYTKTGLQIGDYYFKVAAANAVQTGKQSAVIVGQARPAPVKVSKTITATPKSVTFSWTKSTAAEGYYIWRSTTKGNWTKIAEIKGNTTTTYTDTTSGNYYYCVAMYKTVNGVKYTSYNDDSIIRTRALGATTSYTVTQVGTTFEAEISWPAVSGATGYEVQAKTSTSGSWFTVGTTYTSSITNVQTHGVYYYYRIRAVYEAEGAKTYGAYYEGPSTAGYMISYKPVYSAYISSKTDSDCSIVLLLITNKGNGNMKIRARNARLRDSSYTSFNRDLQLVNGQLYSITELDIPAGESAYVYFLVKGSKTWYDNKTHIWYDFNYDGIEYSGVTSSYYGTSYYKY